MAKTRVSTSYKQTGVCISAWPVVPGFIMGFPPSTTTAASWKTSLINHMYNKAVVDSAVHL